MAKIDEIIGTFNALDEALRLEVLLDYANKLPDLPADLAARADADDGRVHECMTPVWLWVREGEGGGVEIHARVGEEAPTLRGIISVIVHGYSGATAGELAELPKDLVQQLGLGNLVRMNRLVGLSAMIERVRREARALQEKEGASP
jgi:cysteine desulfuration protein SufE